MDLFSKLIQLARPLSCTAGATDAGGDIAIRFPAHKGAFFYSLVAGECWLQVEGDDDPVLLEAGNCVVLPTGRAFVLANNLKLNPTDAGVLFDNRPNGSIETWNGGGQCMMLAAHFEFDVGFSRFLLGALGSVVWVQDLEARKALSSAIQEMMSELKAARAGCEVIVEHLAFIALVKVLRFHLCEVTEAKAGWLSALADRQLSKVIAAIHDNPARPWTVASLASVAAMSRTSFAIRFKTVTGIAPMQHLTEFRMLLAVNMLSQPGARLSKIAECVGYESQSALCAAFKRTTGLTPKQYVQEN